MSSRKNQHRKSIPVYAIVGDGYSEKIYFEQLKAIEELKNIQVKPDLPRKSGKGASFIRVMRKAQELYTAGYDKVYCLIDFDVVLHENKVDLYKNEKSKLEKKGIIVLECNPCFEIWYLLHFIKTAKPFSNCENVVSDIKNTTDLKEYSKEQAFQKNMYKALKDKVPEAINNALFLETNRDMMGNNYPRAEVFKVIKAILNP
jgi:hypothetical protein